MPAPYLNPTSAVSSLSRFHTACTLSRHRSANVGRRLSSQTVSGDSPMNQNKGGIHFPLLGTRCGEIF